MGSIPEFVFYIVVGLILTKVPVVGKYFRLLNTLVHEVGHVLMSLLTSGKVYKVEIFRDTSGVAVTGSRGRFSTILTTLAGYPFSSGVALLFIWLISIERFEIVVYTILVLLVISGMFWVRNLFGFMWIVAFFLITVIIDGYEVTGSGGVLEGYLLLVTAVLLVESVSSALVILRLSFKDSKEAGDATNLARATFIPAVVWGTLFAGQALLIAYVGIKYWL